MPSSFSTLVVLIVLALSILYNAVFLRDFVKETSSAYGFLPMLPVEKALTDPWKHPVPSDCSSDQLEALNRSLPDLLTPLGTHVCSESKYPWYNQCPITKLTGQPEMAWLDLFFQQQYNAESFVAINVGCNKGFDAINLLRMGANNASVDKSKWEEALPRGMDYNGRDQGGGIQGQFSVDTSRPTRSAQVLCIEPMPATIRALETAAKKTQFAGFHVLHYAVNNDPKPGFQAFPSSQNLTGWEKDGIHSCHNDIPRRRRHDIRSGKCEEVKSTTLDLVVEEHRLNDTRIDVMLTDTEGWDGEVLRGGYRTLQRTALLIFEYNWRGQYGVDKANRPLLKLISMLEGIDFVCYWPGNQSQLFRITGCWRKAYEGTPFWSNVVCVNPHLAPELALRMEGVFLETIAKNQTYQG
jgi:FkbM family methyltransferase